MNLLATRLPQIALLLFLPGCTLSPLQCYLLLKDYEKVYSFDCSISDLKDRIVEAYSYDESWLLKNLGKSLIENEKVNVDYRKSTVIWLDKQNWDRFKTEIRNNTSDTLNIVTSKHHSRKQIRFTAVIEGDSQQSSLTVNKFEYYRKNACEKDTAYYRTMLSKKIEKKFVEELK